MNTTYGDRVLSRSQAPTQVPGSSAPRSAAADGRPPAPPRTLWEEGTRPAMVVIRAALLVALAATVLSLLFGNRIGGFFDLVFVLVCVAAALLVRPQDFFPIGVLPPLLLGFVVVVLTVADRGAVAKADDHVLQAVVSGLAHHSLALVVGYTLTLLVLALRQVALRHHGTLRLR